MQSAGWRLWAAPAKEANGAGQEPEGALRVREMVAPARSPRVREASIAAMGRQADCLAFHESRREGPPNKRMKQTKLSPAPCRGRRCRLMPAPAGMDAGTASQLIRGVGRTSPSAERRNSVARIAGRCW